VREEQGGDRSREEEDHFRKPDRHAVIPERLGGVRDQKGDQVDVDPVAEERGKTPRVERQSVPEQLAVGHVSRPFVRRTDVPRPDGKSHRLDRERHHVHGEGAVDGCPDPAKDDDQQHEPRDRAQDVDSRVPANGLATRDDSRGEHRIEGERKAKKRKGDLLRPDRAERRVADRSNECCYDGECRQRQSHRQSKGLRQDGSSLPTSREEPERLWQAELEQDRRRGGQEDEEVVVALGSRTEQPCEEDAAQNAEGGAEDLGAEQGDDPAGEGARPTPVVHQTPRPATRSGRPRPQATR
jgi:hypothetical protein